MAEHKLTAADLDRLAALDEAATPGPWAWDAERDFLTSESEHVLWPGERRSVPPYLNVERADADLIAASRNALPSLLALARRGLEAEADPNFKRYVEASLRADRAETDLAAALAEVERLRGRLERATNFSWRNGAVWLARPEGATTWCVYKELGSCGAALVGTYDSIDAAWSAAEKAAQAQGGEGTR